MDYIINKDVVKVSWWIEICKGFLANSQHWVEGLLSIEQEAIDWRCCYYFVEQSVKY